jgi:hypothetical protein
MSQSEVLAEVRKNSFEVVQVRRAVYRRVPLLDVRVWRVSAVPGDSGRPTRKGIALRPETWAEVLPALAKAVEEDTMEGGRE